MEIDSEQKVVLKNTTDRLNYDGDFPELELDENALKLVFKAYLVRYNMTMKYYRKFL